MQAKRFTRAALVAALMTAGLAQAGSLTIESWRVDDKTLWEDVLIPAFNKKYPDIKVKFSPTAPTEYDSSLTARLTGGTAGDLITLRPFDKSLDLFKKGNLDALNGKQGLENFPASAKVAWQTDDGKTVFGLPIASVIHGVLYNKKMFQELGLQVPKTTDEFFKVAEAVKKAGKTPIALGTADQWESSQIVFTSFGAPFWKGEEGRKALIAGTAKFTDAPYVAAFDLESKFGPYLAKGYQAQTYGDTQTLFASGKAAMVPAGSWDISYYNTNAKFELGAFPPPVPKAGDKCYISDHTDLGMGVNSKSKNKEDAYKFIQWMGSQEFADLYTNKVTGFFSLSSHLIAVKDPVAKQMLDWRKSCASTIRLNAQILNRGEPNMENELWNVNAQVLNGKMTGKDAAARIQTGLSKWYKPGK
ncbi:Multiple sugar-binding protein [Andreprevotia sp. IGB-42]|uniref:ABC transporter substrate-binding protein n=1 Tax=Andreprevotia sp. IGB-42 TaxID=2497473 RepID=UPI001356FA40|nr:ABC transporter substrate-binding protein [Andreprevotia sp. IGB-42]KAF0813957.1 Multiple sugar-binding protein [Andreprevotia sp. IGB-42]